MAYGVARGPPVEEAELVRFADTIASLPSDAWRERVSALRDLVSSIPDYSTSPRDEHGIPLPMTPGAQQGNGGSDEIIPWYRSSKSVRRLAPPLKTLLSDARSAVAKEATELIATLMAVKLQPHPSFTMGDGNDDALADAAKNGGLETISGGLQRPPPPACVGRLLLKDLLPAILDLSKQTVKVIRTYGVNMMVDILPHCRIKSCLVVLLERMKTHPNRTVREDCARYLRCVLETWPWDPTGSCDNISNEGVGIVNSRKEERLSLDSTRQIGLGLGRTLSDSAKPVREEAKKGFQVLFKRFRPVWDEVMNSGVVRDYRLRKKLLEAAGAEGDLFDDVASVGSYSLNTAVSGLTHTSYRSNMSHRSYASRGGSGVPSLIGTPAKGESPRMRSRGRYTPSSSPSYMRGTGASASRNAGQQTKVQAKEASATYTTNRYVTSSGHVLSTPTRRVKSLRREEGATDSSTPQQPFASLLQTPSRSSAAPAIHQSPESTKKSRTVLRKRLSRRISGVKGDFHEQPHSPSHLTSICETGDNNVASQSTVEDTNEAEITKVALEVIAAHLMHLDEVEAQLSQERDLLVDLNKKLGISISDATKTAELADKLGNLSEIAVCEYFESVHVCVDKQRQASETLIHELEKISEGDSSAIASPESSQRRDLPQSPLGHLSRDLRDEFG
ncbi:hypothetical protein ACHAXT_003157 [Thalassiosira profunda]